MLKLFLKLELGKGAKYFRTKRLAKSITGSLFLLVFLLIFIGIYFFFAAGFSYINSNVEQALRLPITLFIYEIFLAVLAGIIVFSCTISSIFSLFRGANDGWIISSPAFKMFPKLVFTRSLLISAWPFFVAFLPAVLALYKVHSLSILSMFFIFLSFAVLLILLNAATLAVIIAISCIYLRISGIIGRIRFSFKGLIAVMLILIGAAASLIWKVSGNTDLVKLFRADEASAAADLSGISSHFFFLPTHPFALEIINWQSNRPWDAMADFMTISVVAALFVFVLWRISGLFYPAWLKLQEGAFRETKDAGASPYVGTAFRFSGGSIMALFKKEALVSMRNPRGILWFLFLSFIWLSQLGANTILSSNIQRHQTDMSQKLAVIQALQFIVAIYFICSFTLRFVFPAFSVEKRTAWILASAPLSFKRIYFGKYLFYVIFFTFVGIVMSLINVSILNLPFAYAAYTMLLFISVVIFIVTLGLSLGAIFPNFETDDPEVISTSIPGLFFTALSLIYGAMGDWILYVSIVGGNMNNLLLFVLGTFVLISILLLKTPDWAGNRIFSES